VTTAVREGVFCTVSGFYLLRPANHRFMAPSSHYLVIMMLMVIEVQRSTSGFQGQPVHPRRMKARVVVRRSFSEKR
jgi:hypothetical protein